MRVVDVSFVYDENLQTEEQQLKQHYTSVGWAEALQRKGVEVICFKRFSRENSLRINNVQYYFFKDKFGGKLNAWQIPIKFLKRVAELDADVIHLHGFGFTFTTILLRLMTGRKTALIVQDHKSSGGMRRYLHQVMNSMADGFFFTSLEYGKEWFRFKWQSRKIMPALEGSPFFNYEERDMRRSFDYYDRAEGRKKTGMTGDPVFLWAGRLHEHKDPLTVLDGFEILFEEYPTGVLYMIYGDQPLIKEVKDKISRSGILNERVHLLGKIKHEEVANYYNSSDYFVLGSHIEGTCYSLSEALSCGCIPIITNISNFRTMTNDGRLGALWEVGDKNSFVEAAKIAISKPRTEEGKACIAFFKSNLSYDAIAQVAIEHYQKLIAYRPKK